MKLLLACAIALSSLSACASDARTQKAERIARVLGLEEILNEAKRSSADAVKGQVQMVLQGFRRSGMKEPLLQKYEELAEQMVSKVVAAWDPKQASRIYADGLSDSLSDQELDEAEKYFSSSEGQKAYTAVSSSQAKMIEYINSRTTEVLQEELAKFIQRIRQAAAKR